MAKKAYIIIDHDSSNELSRVLVKLNTEGEDMGCDLGLEKEVLKGIRDESITLLRAEYSPLRDEITFRKGMVDVDEDAEPSGDTSDGEQPLVVIDWELI